MFKTQVWALAGAQTLGYGLLFYPFIALNEAWQADFAWENVQIQRGLTFGLIPGALDTIEWTRSHGLKIGTTTGYTRSIMDQVLPLVKAQGFEADFVVCSDEVSEGRPAPLGIYKNLVELGVHPTSQALKIDDTAPGIYEGLNAGCPTVGLTESGNSSAEDLSMANHLIGSVAELPALIEKYYG